MRVTTVLNKGELLERYAKGEPNKIIIVNGYNVPKNGDEIIPDTAMTPLVHSFHKDSEIDENHRSLLERVRAGITYELSSDSPDIKILIKPGSDEKANLKLLSEMAEYIEAHLHHLEHFSKETEAEAKQRTMSSVLYQNNISDQELKWYLSKQR